MPINQALFHVAKKPDFQLKTECAASTHVLRVYYPARQCLIQVLCIQLAWLAFIIAQVYKFIIAY